LITGIPGLLAILLRNLIDNAIRYSPRSSRVTVELGQNRGAVVLTVIDQGPGLPAAERDKLGQRFYRVLGSGASGSGLGLSIVKRIVEIHQAELSFAAGEQGKGLQVRITFAAQVKS
jgi:two-component system sensor histidine kinase QseC